MHRQSLAKRRSEAARRLGDRRVADGQREAKLEAGRQFRFHPLAHQKYRRGDAGVAQFSRLVKVANKQAVRPLAKRHPGDLDRAVAVSGILHHGTNGQAVRRVGADKPEVLRQLAKVHL